MESPVSELIPLRPYLFRIAYSMTGNVPEAEDIVQDTFEKWLNAGAGKEVQSLKAYLARMVVNRSIDRLEALKREREAYTGTWLPEPFITEETTAEPSIDYGLLFLLERLNPIERAVFILRESFSEEYEAIAALTGQTAENCRQLLHRAKEKLHGKTARTVDQTSQRQLVEAFLLAMQQQDRSALENLLRHDIELYSDGGGKRAAALKPLFGFDKVFKFLHGVVELAKSQAFSYRPAFVNGQPCALLYNDATGELDSMVTVACDGTGISQLYFVRNPDKLAVRN